MSPRILALDLSLTGTGIAAIGADRRLRLSTVDGTRTDGHRRLQHIHATIAGTVLVVEPQLVVIEDIYQGLKGATALQLAGLHTLVRHWLWLRGVPYVLVNNTWLKQYALGKGSGPDTGKDAVLLAVERRYGLLAVVGDNNQADALVLLAMALDHYGHPLAPVAAKHRAALAKVRDWPALEPAGDSASPAVITAPAGDAATRRMP